MKTGGNNKKNLWIALAAVSAVAVVVCLVLAFLPKNRGSGDSSSSDPYGAFSNTSSQTSTSKSDTSSGTVDVPVDFAKLQERNKDIYAWLSFPQAEVEEPILRREGEDEYYLRKDLDEKYSIAGSLFTESSYNTATFTDPVTMIYGHNMDDGSMFGKLETWAMQQTELGEDATFTIYQPERKLTYRVFAAVPYDNSHVMYYNDFADANIFNQFFVDITDMRDLSARVERSAKPTDGDKVVILSTCLTGDSDRRFLVMGVLTEDSNQTS